MVFECIVGIDLSVVILIIGVGVIGIVLVDVLCLLYDWVDVYDMCFGCMMFIDFLNVIGGYDVIIGVIGVISVFVSMYELLCFGVLLMLVFLFDCEFDVVVLCWCMMFNFDCYVDFRVVDGSVDVILLNLGFLVNFDGLFMCGDVLMVFMMVLLVVVVLYVLVVVVDEMLFDYLYFGLID